MPTSRRRSHLAGIGGGEPAEDREQRGLARAVGPEQAEHFAPVDPQIDAVEGEGLSESLTECVHFEDGRHPGMVSLLKDEFAAARNAEAIADAVQLDPQFAIAAEELLRLEDAGGLGGIVRFPEIVVGFVRGHGGSGVRLRVSSGNRSVVRDPRATQFQQW
jgi:hypothetical protein